MSSSLSMGLLLSLETRKNMTGEYLRNCCSRELDWDSNLSILKYLSSPKLNSRTAYYDYDMDRIHA